MATNTDSNGRVTNQQVILERIEAVKCDLAEVRGMISELTRDYRSFREAYTKENVPLSLQAAAAHRRLDEHKEVHAKLEVQVEELKKQLTPLVLWGKVVAFVGSAVMLSVIALIWSLITGQVHMVFP